MSRRDTAAAARVADAARLASSQHLEGAAGVAVAADRVAAVEVAAAEVNRPAAMEAAAAGNTDSFKSFLPLGPPAASTGAGHFF